MSSTTLSACALSSSNRSSRPPPTTRGLSPFNRQAITFAQHVPLTPEKGGRSVGCRLLPSFLTRDSSFARPPLQISSRDAVPPPARLVCLSLLQSLSARAMNHSALQRLHRSHDDLKNASSSIRRTTGTIPPPRVRLPSSTSGAFTNSDANVGRLLYHPHRRRDLHLWRSPQLDPHDDLDPLRPIPDDSALDSPLASSNFLLLPRSHTSLLPLGRRVGRQAGRLWRRGVP